MWRATLEYNTENLKSLIHHCFVPVYFMTHQQKVIFAINLVRLASNEIKNWGEVLFLFFPFLFSPLFPILPFLPPPPPLLGGMSHSISAAFNQLLTPLLIYPCQRFHISTTRKFHYQSLFLRLPVNIHFVNIGPES